MTSGKLKFLLVQHFRVLLPHNFWGKGVEIYLRRVLREWWEWKSALFLLHQTQILKWNNTEIVYGCRSIRSIWPSDFVATIQFALFIILILLVIAVVFLRPFFVYSILFLNLFIYILGLFGLFVRQIGINSRNFTTFRKVQSA